MAPIEEYGAPETIRTSDLPLRRRLLYPAELRGRCIVGPCQGQSEHIFGRLNYKRKWSESLPGRGDSFDTGVSGLGVELVSQGLSVNLNPAPRPNLLPLSPSR